MAEEKKDSKSKIIIVLLIVVIVLLVAGVGVGLFFVLGNNTENNSQPDITKATLANVESNSVPVLDYDGSAVGLDQESLQQAYDELQKRAEDGYVNLSYKNEAHSNDGVNFACYLENPLGNKFDMFFNIYKDTTLEEQVYLSGLVAPGSAIENFQSEIKLDPGEYQAIIIFTSVDETHTNMVSQVPVEFKLVVNENN